jgi:hypothetical protein
MKEEVKQSLQRGKEILRKKGRELKKICEKPKNGSGNKIKNRQVTTWDLHNKKR